MRDGAQHTCGSTLAVHAAGVGIINRPRCTDIESWDDHESSSGPSIRRPGALETGNLPGLRRGGSALGLGAWNAAPAARSRLRQGRADPQRAADLAAGARGGSRPLWTLA
jgi:hypothetical protein